MKEKLIFLSSNIQDRNSWYNFSFDDPLVAPVIARQHCIEDVQFYYGSSDCLACHNLCNPV